MNFKPFIIRLQRRQTWRVDNIWVFMCGPIDAPPPSWLENWPMFLTSFRHLFLFFLQKFIFISYEKRSSWCVCVRVYACRWFDHTIIINLVLTLLDYMYNVICPCVCMSVCVCVLVYRYLWMNVYVCIWMCVCTSVSVDTHTYRQMSVWVCMCECG